MYECCELDDVIIDIGELAQRIRNDPEVREHVVEAARMIRNNPEVREYLREAANADVYMVLNQLLEALNDALRIDDK